MAKLSTEERISRIEQAPAEVQVMVAKAFLRDDIDDEDVQYLFNSDTPEELNDPDEHYEIENLNAEDPEGIGAAGFTMRTSRPANNNNFIVTGSGGWNTCIKGNPLYGPANALANCVGYASGRFNEIINIARDTSGCTYKTLNCNAVGFKERAEAAGLQTGSTPRRGAIMCWGKEGGAGHVAIVERVDSNNQVYTSESGWGSSAIFWNQTRTNNNGKWGCGSGYYFRCFIYLPDDVQKLIDGGSPAPGPGPSGKFNIGDHVIINGPLYVNSNASSPAGNTGDKDTYITRKNPGSAHPYNTTGDLGWMDESSIRFADPQPTPTPTPSTGFNVGDHVIINGPLYVSSDAASPAGSVSDRETYITRKVNAPHPYNTTGDLGWMDESSIRKYEDPQPTPPEPTPTPTPSTEVKGLDISNYQDGISFDAIKNSEYGKFVILRAGFTGWGTGVNYNKDKSFEGFYAEAKAKGIPVGAYWYSCANTYDKGVAEANYMYENCLKGKQFEYPIYMDVEDSHWQVGNKAGVTAAIKGFCETLEAKKYYVGIYGSDISGFQEKMNIDELNAYDKWVARYGSAPQYVKSYGMWQTSSSGRISGYSSDLDTDIAYKDYPTIMKTNGYNGYAEGPAPVPPTPEPPAPTPSLKYNIGDRVVIDGGLYVSSDAAEPAGHVSNKVTNITRRVDGAAHPYNTTGDLGWMNESDIQPYNEPAPQPEPEGLKVGDTVKIIGYGNGSAYGGANVAGGIGWTRTILRIYDGKPYPYMVGNNSGVTGFYTESSLQKL